MEKMIIANQSTSEALALTPRSAVAPRSLEEVFKLASLSAKTGMFGVKSQEEAAVRIITGMELGLSPFQAMRGIHVLNGRPVLAADLMVAVCMGSEKCEFFSLIESTDAIATYETKRRGAPPTRLSWTMDQAKKAGLAGRGTWSAHPAAMLRARCSAALARVVYPDLINGLYDPDEAQDADRAPSNDVHVESVTVEPTYVADTQPSIDEYGPKIKACQTLAELNAIGAELGKLDKKSKESLKQIWLARQAEIKAQTNAAT